MRTNNEQGFSITELVVVMSLFTIFTSFAVSNLRALDNPLQDSSSEMLGFFKQVRARAVSTTNAYIVEPAGDGHVVTRYAASCSSTTTTADPQLTVVLPESVALTDISWSVCFNSRGFADDNITVSLQDAYFDSKAVEVYLGGGARLL